MADAGNAVFRAVANFRQVVSESRAASEALKQVSKDAAAVGEGADKGEKSFSGAATRIGETSRGLAEKMEKHGKKMTVGFTAPLTLIGTVAVHAFADFESAIVAAGSKTNATTQQMAKMKSVALEMGAKTKFSAGEAASAMDVLASAGMDANGVIGSLPAVLIAAQASGEDLSLTAQTVAQSMNAFALDTKDAGHVADVFASAANTSALNMQTLGEAMAHAGQLGASAHQKIEDVVAAVGNLVNQGVPAASAGAAISQAIMSLQAPTGPAAVAIKALGLELRDAKGQMLPLPKLLQNLKYGLSQANPAFRAMTDGGKMTDKQMKDVAAGLGITVANLKKLQQGMAGGGQAAKDFAMNTIFGVEGMKAVNLSITDGKPLIVDRKKDLDQWTRLQKGLNLELGEKGAAAFIKAHLAGDKFTATGADAVQAMSALAKASDGVSQSIADKMGKTSKQTLDNMKGSFETLAISVIGIMAPALNTIATDVGKVANAVNTFAQAHPNVTKFVGALAAFLAVSGPLMVIGSKIVSVYGRVFSLMGKIAGLGGKKAAAKLAEKAAGCAEEVAQAEGCGEEAGAAHAEGFVKKAAAGLKTGVGKVWQGVTAAARTAARATGTAVQGATRAFSALGRAAMTAGAAVGRALLTLVTAVGRAMLAIGRMILANPWILLIVALVAIVYLVIKHWDTIKKVVGEALSWLGDKIGKVWGWIKDTIGAAISWVVNFARRHWMLLVGIIAGPLGLAVAWVIKHWRAIKQHVTEGVNFVIRIVKSVLGAYLAFWRSVWNTVKAVLSAVWEGIKAVVRAAIGLVKAIVQRELNGIKAIWTTVWNGMKTFLTGIWDGIKKVVGAAIDWLSDKIGKIAGPIKDVVGAVGKVGGVVGKGLSKLPGFSEGGEVPGTGSGDTVPAMLEPGEFVLKKVVARRLGKQALTLLNEGHGIFGTNAMALMAEAHDARRKERQRRHPVRRDGAAPSFEAGGGGGGSLGGGRGDMSRVIGAPHRKARPEHVRAVGRHLIGGKGQAGGGGDMLHVEHLTLVSPREEKPSDMVARAATKMAHLGLFASERKKTS